MEITTERRRKTKAKAPAAPPINGNFLAIDFETANYKSDSACSVGLVKVVNSKVVKEKAYLIRPPSRDFVFTYIHGLSWKHVAKAPTFGDLWPEIEDYFDGVDFFAAHNAGFDRRVLEACCDTYRIKKPKPSFVCTVQVARKTWGLYPTKLSDVCRHLSIKLNHHEALSDAQACAKIVLSAGNDNFVRSNA